MIEYILDVQTREEKGRKTSVLRENGLVPAVVYGVDTKPQNITLDRNQFVKTYQAAGESSIIELKVDGKIALHVLIQDYQLDPLRDEVTHVDFRSVDMNKLIETELDLKFVGESPAVKALGGTLMLSREAVAIRCLPSKLIRSLDVDISLLKTFDDVIRVSDLLVQEGVEIMEETDLAIASVQAPRSDAEIEALNAAIEEDVSSVATAVEKKEVVEEEAPEAKK